MDEKTATKTFNLFGLQLPVRLTVITILSTLLLMVDHYHRFLPAETAAQVVWAKAIERVVYYLLIPLFTIVVLFRDRPADYGFTLGNWRQGLKWTLLVVLIGTPILFLAARTPAMTEYYARVERTPLEVLLTVGLDLVGWEFLFRGFILFGYLHVIGPSAVLLQAVPFALAHLGKPELETMSTIFGGTLFGWVAWRAGSFVYPFLIHWFINAFVVIVALTAAG